MGKFYYLETYGCQMNGADSQLVAGLLEREGYQPTRDLYQADAIFVNTCAIREHAEAKVHSRLGRYGQAKKRRPEVVIGVLGCMAQHLKDDLLEKKPYVDVVLGPDSYRQLPALLRARGPDRSSVVDTRLSRFEVYAGLFPSRQEGINAWVSIMRGCDKFCTFCIVPFTRGRERSRSVDSIVREVEQAVAEGFVEVTLLGQNVNSYRWEEQCFHHLLEAVARISGVPRIRYTSPHPQDMSPELLHTMARHDTICKAVHLPLQAGSDRILKRMNRSYSQDHFITLARTIRRTLPGCSLSTDIIVGFPGEDRNDFQATLEVMEEVRFDSAYTFKYSPRPGTKAWAYTNQVPEGEKQDRLETLIALQKRHTLERNQALVGQVEVILVEKESVRSEHQWSGRTDSNKWVSFDKGQAAIKDLVAVEINAARGISLQGRLVQGSR